MAQLEFEWNSKKDALNRRRHGVSFIEAQSVFADEFARLIPDPDNSTNEDRFILLGMSQKLRLLVVCHCIRREDAIRIISARKANSAEIKIYQDFRNA